MAPVTKLPVPCPSVAGKPGSLPPEGHEVKVTQDDPPSEDEDVRAAKK
jgi:hypothetical protein